jgi:hypothetical protein
MGKDMLRAGFAVFLGLAAVSIALTLLPAPAPVQAVDVPAPPDAQAIRSSQWTVPTTSLNNTLVLAHWLGWFGLPNHRQPVPSYQATDPSVISRQIDAAQRLGIDGFIVDWYGPATGLPLNNEADRAFIDEATQALFVQAQNEPDFHVALMYDYGTLRDVASSQRTDRMITDLRYAIDTYLSNPTYLTYNNRPLLFVFPYDDVRPDVRLVEVTNAISQADVNLIYQNPSTDTTILPYVDGFFAWVQPTTYDAWQPNGGDWGGGYLDWFYQTMSDPTLPYSQMLTVGAVWPGFNDSLAPWRSWSPRFIARRAGQTWDDIWELAVSHQPPLIQIVTWNDWEEDTAIEPGESNGTWAGAPIHTMDGVTPWFALQGTSAISVALAKRAGHDDGAVEIGYGLSDSPAVTQDNWVQMRHDFNPALDIAAGDLIRFWFRGTPGVTNSLEMGLVESQAGQPILGRQLNQVTQVPAWVYTTLSYDAFIPWGETVTQTSGQLDAFFISVVKVNGTEDQGGSGAVAIDGLQYLHSMSRSIPTAFESVVVSPTRAASAAAWIASQQQPSGLVQSWEEETPGRAWLYDQALALIVLSETDMTRATTLAEELASLQNTDGSWYDGYYVASGSPLTINKWEGSVAWLVYALTRYVANGGSPSYMTNAISGATWLKSRQMDFADGRVHTSTEATLDAWWAFQATGFEDEAEKVKRYLLEEVWREDQKRWNRGYQDPVIVLDTQTWGASFAKAVCEPAPGLAALSFAEYTLSTTSFSGAIRGLDGAGPFSVWNEGTAQYVVAGGPGAQCYLNELRRQQRGDGAMPGSPDSFRGDDVWLTRWHGIAPTAWLYFAETGGPFAPTAACHIYLPVVIKNNR